MEPLHEGDPRDWDVMLDTNVRGLLNVTREVLPGMVRRGGGHVLNIGSIAGHESYLRGVVYCARGWSRPSSAWCTSTATRSALRSSTGT
ncbi:hypothetical protein BH20ACT9_BH20ACT9_22390 [soil metagenome]